MNKSILTLLLVAAVYLLVAENAPALASPSDEKFVAMTGCAKSVSEAVAKVQVLLANKQDASVVKPSELRQAAPLTFCGFFAKASLKPLISGKSALSLSHLSVNGCRLAAGVLVYQGAVGTTNIPLGAVNGTPMDADRGGNVARVVASCKKDSTIALIFANYGP